MAGNSGEGKGLVWATSFGAPNRMIAGRIKRGRFIQTPGLVVRLHFEQDGDLLCYRSAPLNGDALHAIQSFFEQLASAYERKTQEVFAFGTKRRAGNSGNACFFQQNLLNFLGGGAGVFDIDPGVERAIRGLAAKARNT